MVEHVLAMSGVSEGMEAFSDDLKHLDQLVKYPSIEISCLRLSRKHWSK